MALEETLIVSDVLHFNIKYLTFECRPDTEFEEYKAVVVRSTDGLRSRLPKRKRTQV